MFFALASGLTTSSVEPPCQPPSPDLPPSTNDRTNSQATHSLPLQKSRLNQKPVPGQFDDADEIAFCQQKHLMSVRSTLSDAETDCAIALASLSWCPVPDETLQQRDPHVPKSSKRRTCAKKAIPAPNPKLLAVLDEVSPSGVKPIAALKIGKEHSKEEPAPKKRCRRTKRKALKPRLIPVAHLAQMKFVGEVPPSVLAAREALSIAEKQPQVDAQME